MRRLSCFFKRAAILSAALFFLNTKLVLAAPKTETYRDIIEKSYNLSLQKERTQAIAVLVNAIKKETKKNPKAVKELIKALEQVSTVFYNDKSQQLYELGISMKLSDPILATAKVNEALKLEPDNQAIIMAQIRLMILGGDCSRALSQAAKLKETNPFSEEIDLAASQAAVCSGQFDQYQQSKTNFDEKKSALATHWQVVEIEYQYKAGNFARARDMSQSLQKTDPHFPEAYFWEWKTEVEMKEKAEIPANKYVSLCKGLSTRAQRQYFNEPLLCRRTADVETFLKKNNNPTI